MLSSFLNSVIMLFKEAAQPVVSGSEDDRHATGCEITNGCDALGCDGIISGIPSNHCVITHDAALLSGANMANSDKDDADIYTMHTNMVNADESRAKVTNDDSNDVRITERCEYRTRTFTVDDSLLEAARLTGEDAIRLRHQDPTFFRERLEKCVSLPNIFRTTSIQDKSMKISRKRRERKHARQIQNRLKYRSSESESEFKETKRDVLEDNRRVELEDETNDTNTGIADSVNDYKFISKSFDSLMDELRADELSSDSDEYFSCSEEILDDDIKTYLNKHKVKKLRRISSIQKRSWTIRQRRRENMFKRRSMDVET